MSSPEREMSDSPEILSDEEMTRAWESMSPEAKRRALERVREEDIAILPPSLSRRLQDRMDAVVNRDAPFDGIPAGQEPEVMPGFNRLWVGPPPPPIIFSADPWPPLSREQVVELHEALRMFRQSMDNCGNQRVDGAKAVYAEALHRTLQRLNIGTPPQPHRWTDSDIQAAVASSYGEDLGGFACLDERRMLPDEEEPTATLVTSPLGEVKHNCWTCRHNLTGVGAWGCGSGEMGVVRWLSQMANELLPQDDGSRMPSRTSDNCPGWEPKP